MQHRLDLGGTWTVCQKKTTDAFDATVPGDIYNDLLNAGKIEDPFYRDNENDVQWVGDVDWAYARTFDVPADVLQRDVVLLRCEGLDTVCVVRINGRRVGAGENAFRTYEWDVKKLLKPGENRIEVDFVGSAKAARMAHKTMGSASPPCDWTFSTYARNYLRKMQCNTGWDWGIRLPAVGIWRDIAVVAYDGARIGGTLVEQEHTGGKVKLTVTADVEAATAGKRSVALSVTLAGKTVAEADAVVRRGRAVGELTIETPKLWWPNDMGDQPLYQVTVDLLDAEGEVLDSDSQRVGLRTIELVRKKDRWGESFHFAVNGKAFFAKGTNWIPGDAIFARMAADDYRRLLTDAAAVHMNMVRVWGGGIYEQDCFYDLCDELGLLVWQDFMFACASYPADVPAFMDSVAAEAEDNVRRLRNHPCIALWCGNNELEQSFGHGNGTWEGMDMKLYEAIFDKLLPKTVQRFAPGQAYWPSSPHTPKPNREDHGCPTIGDAHMWAVWHGGKPFEFYRTCEHRFQSEFGFQSFPEPRTVHGYTADGDRNVTSPVMEHHQRCHAGNAKIFGQMTDRFRMPKDFNSTLWLSQIQQGFAIQYAVEHFRRTMPRCMGSLIWQINDNWPVASWSSIDYHGRWKALHYMTRRFYAPVLLSILEDAEKGRADIHVTSDLDEPVAGKIVWSLIHVDGRRIASASEPAKIAPRKSARAVRLELADVLKEHGAGNVILFADLTVGGRVVSSNIATFTRIKGLDLQDPKIRTAVKDLKDGTFEITLQAKAPALFCWARLKDADCLCSDNFLHLEPGTKTTILLQPAKPMSKAQLDKQLVVESLIDTYK